MFYVILNTMGYDGTLTLITLAGCALGMLAFDAFATGPAGSP